MIRAIYTANICCNNPEVNFSEKFNNKKLHTMGLQINNSYHVWQ